MKTSNVDHLKNDLALNQIIESCNSIQTTVHKSQMLPVSRGETGPLRWRESCDKKIAIAGDILQFRLTLEMPQVTDECDVVQVALSRTYGPNLMFDQIVSTHIDGKPARPTNQSMHRSLDLHFNAIQSGSTVVIRYQVRVDRTADPSIVALDNIDVRWAFRSQSKRDAARKAHTASPGVSAPHVTGLVPAARAKASALTSSVV